MTAEWYKINYKREPNCILSNENIRDILGKSLDELTEMSFDNEFESEDWNYWEKIKVNLETISKRLPNVLLTVDVENEDNHGSEKFYRYYAKNGQVNEVDSIITYPEFVENKELAYIRDFIKEEIDYYADNSTNPDSIDDDTVRAIVGAYTNIATLITFAQDFGHITNDEANNERQRFIEHFSNIINL